MVVVIDSYEELFGGSAESETANITVQIDKLLEDFISETNGILRKYSKDRFWAVIEERHVKALIEDKVKILDKAREIQVNDRLSVTLSIGIGRTGKTIAESEVLAKQALDMALGRGGDQAAIKTENGFEFYGGVSKGVERHTKVKTRIIANSLMEAIEQSDNVYIMGHRNSDLDSVGASVGLASAIRKLGKNAFAVIDKNTTLSIQLYNYIYEKEKAYVFTTAAEAKESFGENSLLIIVDTHNPLIVDVPELLERAEFFGYFIAIGKTDDLGDKDFPVFFNLKLLCSKWIGTVAIRNEFKGFAGEFSELIKGHAHCKDTGAYIPGG